MHGDPNFFYRRLLPFLIPSNVPKNKKQKIGAWEVLIFSSFRESNCYINTGVHDLEVALFKTNST